MSQSLCALIVEDSPAMRQLIKHALRRIPNLRVDEAEDGVQGLKRIREGTFDMLLTDINMPMMDGLKLIDLVRKNPAYEEVPIIVVTTEGALADRQRALELGANAYITKPIRASQLVDCVRNLLAHKL